MRSAVPDGHMAISFSSALQAIDVALLPFQACLFAHGELPRLDALLDPVGRRSWRFSTRCCRSARSAAERVTTDRVLIPEVMVVSLLG